MINAHESGSNFQGTGAFRRDSTKTKSLQCRSFTWALHMEKSISPLFPGPRGDEVANEWCINCCQLQAKVCAQSTGLPLDQACAGKECGYICEQTVPTCLYDHNLSLL